MSFFMCVLFLLPTAEERTLSFRVSGQIKEVLVKPGDTIQPGQLLVQLDDENAALIVQIRRSICTSRLQEADAHISALRQSSHWLTMLCRDVQLLGQVPLPEQLSVCWADYQYLVDALTPVRPAWHQLQAARWGLALAQETLEQHALKSEVTGVVVAVHKKPQEFIAPGEMMLTIRVDRK